MSSIPTTSVRIEPKLKEQANEVLEGLGLNLSVAVNAFLRAVVRERGIPFDMSLESRRRED